MACTYFELENNVQRTGRANNVADDRDPDTHGEIVETLDGRYLGHDQRRVPNGNAEVSGVSGQPVVRRRFAAAVEKKQKPFRDLSIDRCHASFTHSEPNLLFSNDHSDIVGKWNVLINANFVADAPVPRRYTGPAGVGARYGVEFVSECTPGANG